MAHGATELGQLSPLEAEERLANHRGAEPSASSQYHSEQAALKKADRYGGYGDKLEGKKHKQPNLRHAMSPIQ